MGLSLKLALVSATVLSTAVMLAPSISDFAISDVHTIWTTLISWLKPPYLYVVINGIIITIFASSRLQSKLDHPHSLSTVPTAIHLPTEPVKVVLPVEIPPVHELEAPFHASVFVNGPVMTVAASYGNSSEVVQVPERDLSGSHLTDKFTEEDLKISTEVYKEIANNCVTKSVISMSTWTPPKVNHEDVYFPMEKPPVSARFSHRKPVKATAEGGRTLGVSKPKRQDTLETTWKAITEGRPVPLTRHLLKSDTWETHVEESRNGNSDELMDHHHAKRLTKSGAFDVNRGRGVGKPPPPQSKLSRAGGSGRLRKEPSLGQEELNRRVEAFIKKVNEDMRLQRQESLNQYMEMINRGAH